MPSKFAMVINSSRWKIFLIGTTRVITIASPEKIAPATKYGGKIVLCHPGTLDIAKSHDTTLWTEITRVHAGLDREGASRKTKAFQGELLEKVLQSIQQRLSLLQKFDRLTS